MRIISIGGGDVGAGETLAVDQEIIRLTGKKNPNALFIPTASDDSEDYALSIRRAYEGQGCTVDVLRLLSTDGTKEAEEKIDWADLIYVGGGNTKMMLEVWRANGVDKLLENAGHQGKPLSGLSAGAICWYRVGNSDWPLYYPDPKSNTAALDCLDFVDLAICPHTKDEGFRLVEFSEMMRTIPGAGIGLDDCCAIEVIDSTYRIIASQTNSVAHRIFWTDGKLHHEILEPHEDFRMLDDLKIVGKLLGPQTKG